MKSSFHDIRRVLQQMIRVAGPYVLLALLGLFAYNNAIRHPFVHDDVVFIQENPRVTAVNIPEAFLRTASAPNAGVINTYYRPLLDVLYQLQYKFFGLNPHSYHLFNILLHAVNSFLVFGVVQAITYGRRYWFAWGTALIFLLHPVQTEAVACIAGVSNLAYAFFCLLSFYLYLRTHQISVAWKRVVFYSVSLAAFMLGLFAKEQTLILPLWILLYELTLGSRRYAKAVPKTRVLHFAGYCIALIGYFVWRKIILGNALAFDLKFSGEFWLRIAVIPKTLLTYLRILVWPSDLHYYRSQDILAGNGQALWVFLAVCAAVVILLRRSSSDLRPTLVFGLGFFFVSLLPVLNIIPLINEYSLILTAEHFLYLPVIGIVIFIFALAYPFLLRVAGANTTKFCAAILITLSIVCIPAVRIQNNFWAAEIPLFERTLQFENLARVRILLAKAYYEAHEYGRAIEEGQKAIESFERYSSQSKSEEARKVYRGFLKGTHFDLAHSYIAIGKVPEAIAQYKSAIEIDPADSVLYNNLGIAYIMLSQWRLAVENFSQAIAHNPRDIMAMNNLAICYLELNDRAKAKELFEQILAIEPHNFTAKRNLRGLE